MKTQDRKSGDRIFNKNLKVWGEDSWDSLMQDDRTRILNRIGEIWDNEGEEALTNDRLEGVRELFEREMTGDFSVGTGHKSPMS